MPADLRPTLGRSRDATAGCLPSGCTLEPGVGKLTDAGRSASDPWSIA